MTDLKDLLAQASEDPGGDIFDPADIVRRGREALRRHRFRQGVGALTTVVAAVAAVAGGLSVLPHSQDDHTVTPASATSLPSRATMPFSVADLKFHIGYLPRGWHVQAVVSPIVAVLSPTGVAPGFDIAGPGLVDLYVRHEPRLASNPKKPSHGTGGDLQRVPPGKYLQPFAPLVNGVSSGAGKGGARQDEVCMRKLVSADGTFDLCARAYHGTLSQNDLTRLAASSSVSSDVGAVIFNPSGQ